MAQRIKNEGGFSLIEVLITLVVLAVGLVSLAKFQGTAIQSGSLAKERSVAAHLAQEKLDDLRNFEKLIHTDALGALIGCSADIRVSYQCIADNAGGNKNNGTFTLRLPSGNTTVSGVQYNRTWIATNYYFQKTAAGMTPNNAATLTVPTPAPAYPDFKKVTVTVTWRHLRDTTDQPPVKLTSIISASNPLYSGRVLE